MAQKLITLTSKDFLSGLSIGKHFDRGGIFNDDTKGAHMFASENHYGLLCSGPTVSDIGSTAVVDTIIAATSTPDGDIGKLYTLGSEGHLYETDLASPTATPTDKRSATPITNPANGLFVYQTRGATSASWLYYFQSTQIGRWNKTGTHGVSGWTDNWSTAGINTTFHRPTHQFFDRVYFGNKYQVGYLYDTGADDPSVEPGGLDIPKDYTITTLSDDGLNLVIGATRQTASGTPVNSPGTKVYFWDTNNTVSWQREWELLGASAVMSITRGEDGMYALTPEGLYVFSFSEAPRLVIPFTSGSTVASSGFDSNAAGAANHQKMIRLKGGLLWINGDTSLTFYGRFIPQAPKAIHVPYLGFTAATSLAQSGAGRLYIGAADKLYTVALTSTGNTSAVASTVYIPFPKKTTINRIEVVFAEPLNGSDAINIDVNSDEDSNATDWGTISYSTHGAVRRKSLFSAFTCENLKLVINFTGGDVKIKSINVYGEYQESE